MASSARIDELRKKFDENPRRYFAPLANEYRKIGDLDQAIFICQEYLPQQPGHMSGHIVYGQALFETGRLDEARAVFETALTLDPENLIALRHLGDIANGSGDTEAARGWYQRVLEADPRNEEIAAILDTLLSKPEIVATARRSLSMSRHTPAFSWDGATGPDGLPAAGVDEPLVLPSDMVLDRASEAETPVVPIPAQPEPAPAERETPATEPEHELFDISDFNVGVESFASTPATHELDLGSGPAIDTIDLQPEDLQPLPGIETSETLAAEAAALFQDDPLAITGFQDDAIIPTAESITELEADVTAPTPDWTAEVREDTIALASDQTPEKLDVGDAASFAHHDDLASEPFDAADTLPMGMEAVPAAPLEAPFVTETMAELYLQQGHRREAASIYRQLVERRPSDASLRDRLAELEPPERPEPTARPVTEGDGQALAPVGPSIRTFLRELLWEPPAAESASEAPPIDSSSETSSLSTSPEAPPADAAPIASAQDDVSPLDALFPGSPRGDVDDTMASLLAGAYRDEAADDPLRGVPAHRVSGELSLEQVFGDQAGSERGTPAEPTPPGGHGFLNQFFAGSPAGGDAEDVGMPQSEAQPSAAEDIEQFNSWLQGLRNT